MDPTLSHAAFQNGIAECPIPTLVKCYEVCFILLACGNLLGVYCCRQKDGLYMDSLTKQIKTARHVIFDEAGLTLPVAQLTPSAKALQKFGFNQ